MILVCVNLVLSAGVLPISQVLGWTVSVKSGTWQMKAVCAAGGQEACQALQWAVNPQGQITGEGVKVIKDALGPEAAKLADAYVTGPEKVLTQEGLKKFAEENPKEAKTFAEALTIKSQLQALGYEKAQGEVARVENGNWRELTKSSLIDKYTEVGNIVGKDLPKDAISASNFHIEKKDGVTIFDVEKGGYVNVKIGDKVFSYSNLQNGVFKLNEQGELLYAKFTSDGGEYSFRFNEESNLPESFNVEKGSKVSYEKGTVTVQSSGETQASYLNKQVSVSGEKLVFQDNSISGLRFKLDNYEINGKVSIVDDGVIINNGRIIDNKNKFGLAVNEGKENKVLIADGSISSSDIDKYEGSWVWANPEGKEFKAKSREKESVKVNFLEGNKFFALFDEKDNLAISIKNGDGIGISNREDEGKISSISHTSSQEGATEITTDRDMKIAVDRIGLKIKDPEKISGTYIAKWLAESKLQSAPFALSSDSTDIKMVVDSADQYALVGPEEEEKVAYNKYGLKISEYVKDNKLQTIKQLEEKYKERDISFSTFLPSETEVPKELLHLYEHYTPMPVTIKALNQWLEENPNVPIDTIIIAGDEDARATFSLPSKKKILKFGDLVLDPYTGESIRKDSVSLYDRPCFGLPICLIAHEATHIKVDLTTYAEVEHTRSYVEELFEKNDIESKESIIKESIIKSAHDKAEEYFKSTEVQFQKREYFNKFLQYNNYDVTPEGRKVFFEEFKGEFKDWLEARLIEEEVKKTFSKEIEQNYGTPLQKEYDRVIFKSVDYLQSDKDFIRILKDVKEKTKEIEGTGPLNEDSDMLLQAITRGDKTKVPDLVSNFMTPFSTLANNPTLKTLFLEFQEVTKRNGLPAIYALKKYKPAFLEEESGGFAELATTFGEYTPEQVNSIIKEGTPAQRDIFSRLAQIELDSGQTTAEVYMGKTGIKCRFDDCRDYACKIYKVECCRTYHKNSINCEQ